MPITPEQVEYVARLARLALSDEEKSLFARQLDDILAYVEKLNELPTDDVEPLVHVAPRHNVLREDDVAASLPEKEALANAPERTEGHFKVPRIIE